MFDSRRRFLTLLAGAGTVMAADGGSLVAQARPQGQSRPQPSDPTKDVDETTPPLGKSATKVMLEANEKDIKKNIERLYQLATDLKSEVEKTDSSQVLSLTLVKKADEIEKLAHDIKTRAKD
ncbi:MAG: hypothetical protein WBG02_03440 [Candidatus Acidiferrum sp.]